MFAVDNLQAASGESSTVWDDLDPGAKQRILRLAGKHVRSVSRLTCREYDASIKYLTLKGLEEATCHMKLASLQQRFPALQSLRLDRDSVGALPELLKTISSAQLPRLTALSLSSCILNNNGGYQVASCLGQCTHLSGLQRLMLDNCCIGEFEISKPPTQHAGYSARHHAWLQAILTVSPQAEGCAAQLCPFIHV